MYRTCRKCSWKWTMASMKQARKLQTERSCLRAPVGDLIALARKFLPSPPPSPPALPLHLSHGTVIITTITAATPPS
ncbi:hypothetical protein CMUS01_05333 [Colletotrichum musicola]|uniref:Uncharacterized protein n=1 Tax=Colletotrichum musicola TaxID=2175873 RepID=A0A8H6NKD3_9PEZI|nr:hypothetical protein CMUS01_05333 [Colletotrichum musicola]